MIRLGFVTPMETGKAARGLLGAIRGLVLGGLLAALSGLAQEVKSPPILPPGATRDEVIDAYGWPTGQSKLGAKEILSYPQGRVVLEDGRVEAVDFTMKPPWPAPRPRPAWALPTEEVKEAAVPEPEFWLGRFDEAVREAGRRKLPILALFTDAEDSAAGQRFDVEVARSPEFARALRAGLVLLRMNFSARAALPKEVQARHEQLRTTFRIQTLPALRLLSPSGDMRAEFDLSKMPAGAEFRTAVITAVKAARNHLFRHLPEEGAAPATRGPSGPTVSAQSAALDSSMLKARGMLLGAIALGVGVAGLAFWLIWRRRGGKAGTALSPEMNQRISDAASGLPSQLELATWPRERVVALVAAFVEAEGYHVEVIPPPSDCDLVLRREGSPRPQVLILCAGVEVGVVSERRVRKLLGAMVADEVAQAWYVAAAGFAPEAKALAGQHRIQLLDGPELIAQLRELPPLVLPKVLAKAAV